MTNGSEAKQSEPVVEVHVKRNRLDAAQSGGGSRLGASEIHALQTTVADIVSGFKPPATKADPGGYQLEEFEVSIGFKVETGVGNLLRLVLDGKAEAELSASLRWKRSP